MLGRGNCGEEKKGSKAGRREGAGRFTPATGETGRGMLCGEESILGFRGVVYARTREISLKDVRTWGMVCASEGTRHDQLISRGGRNWIRSISEYEKLRRLVVGKKKASVTVKSLLASWCRSARARVFHPTYPELHHFKVIILTLLMYLNYVLCRIFIAGHLSHCTRCETLAVKPALWRLSMGINAMHASSFPVS